MKRCRRILAMLFSLFYPLFQTFGTLFGVIADFWWLFGPIVLFPMLFELWMNYIHTKFAMSINWIDIEVIIPLEIQKTPKAMEQIFAHLHGIQGGQNILEKYLDGEFQLTLSMEIVSIGGDVHFIVHTPDKFKGLVETSIYSQYPAAEIRVVDDYMKALPKSLPDDTYNLWGTELKFLKDAAYPIKTYPQFEFQEEYSTKRIDPLSGIMEAMTTLRPGEIAGLQFILSPLDDKWVAGGQKIIEEMLKKTQGPPMRFMSSGEDAIIKAVGMKMSKLAFATRLRFIYIAPSVSFNKGFRGLVLSAFKQFNTQDLNGLRPDGDISTSVDYFYQKKHELFKKQALYKAYLRRSFQWRHLTKAPLVLNIEELATLYHFPGLEVAAPLGRTSYKKAEPPSGLPIISQ